MLKKMVVFTALSASSFQANGAASGFRSLADSPSIEKQFVQEEFFSLLKEQIQSLSDKKLHEFTALITQFFNQIKNDRHSASVSDKHQPKSGVFRARSCPVAASFCSASPVVCTSVQPSSVSLNDQEKEMRIRTNAFFTESRLLNRNNIALRMELDELRGKYAKLKDKYLKQASNEKIFSWQAQVIAALQGRISVLQGTIYSLEHEIEVLKIKAYGEEIGHEVHFR